MTTPPPAEDPLVTSLLAALAAAPSDTTLRLHVAGVLLERGRAAEALEHCSTVLRGAPTHPEALALLRRAASALPGESAVPGASPLPADGAVPGDGGSPGESERPAADLSAFDWAAAEAEIGDVVPPGFASESADPPAFADVEDATLRLADVGGMEDVKRRLELAFLGPMRNPELAKAFGKSLSGGLLLYGPPGCGKTFLARAVAGELGARFYPIGLADVLDMYVGQSERNIRDIRRTQRRGLRAQRHQPPLGRRHRAAPSGPARPDAAGPPARRRRP